MHLDLIVKVKAEFDKLVSADFIRKLQYPIYIYKVVPLKKKKGKFESKSIFQTQIKLVPKMTSRYVLSFMQYSG